MTAAELPPVTPAEQAGMVPDADAWLERVVEAAVTLADDAGIDPDAAAGMMADDPGPIAGAGAPWSVADDGAAEWAMAHVLAATTQLEQLQRQAAEWHAAADERKARIDQWFAHRARPLQATVGFMSAHLERYAEGVREATKGKRKSVVLPSGVVRTTASSPKVEIADLITAAAWARQHAPEAFQPREPELLVSKLRQVVRPVELTTQAKVTFSCGCIARFDRPDGVTLPDVGTEMDCADHGPVLLGRIDVQATRWVAVCTTDGQPAEGVTVDPGSVTAKVVPAP